jgi:uncharacterized protein (DUF433 family)
VALPDQSPIKAGFDTLTALTHLPLMQSAEPIAHIFRDADGVAWIDRTRVKVIEVALDHVAYGWSAEEIHRQHPHLSLAQIHAALGYYYDRQAAFDAEMAESMAEADRLAGGSANSPLRRRLRLFKRPA